MKSTKIVDNWQHPKKKPRVRTVIKVRSPFLSGNPPGYEHWIIKVTEYPTWSKSTVFEVTSELEFIEHPELGENPACTSTIPGVQLTPVQLSSLASARNRAVDRAKIVHRGLEYSWDRVDS